MAALVRFAQRDVPVTLARTDPALYRRLREQTTRFFLLGGDAFALDRIRSRTQAPMPSSNDPAAAGQHRLSRTKATPLALV